MFTQDYIFLSASPYSMTDKETGEVVKGTSVFLAPVRGTNEDRLVGAKPQKFNQPFDSFQTTYSKLEYLQQYEFEMEARAVGNTVKLILVGLA